MQEYKPFKEGKVRQVFDIGENLVSMPQTEFPHLIIF